MNLCGSKEKVCSGSAIRFRCVSDLVITLTIRFKVNRLESVHVLQSSIDKSILLVGLRMKYYGKLENTRAKKL